MSTYKVGDKFIIEIAEVYENELSGIDVFEAATSEPLYRIKGFNSLVFDKNGLDKIEKIKPTLTVPYSEAYEKGMNDTWDIARELCKTGYSECNEIFGDETVEHVIKNYMPLEVKEKIEYFNKAINTIKEYNLDSQGFNETMKKIIEDEKIDTDRLWKLEAESPEKRYVRCIGFEYESKKYIVDSVLQKMFCENDPDYDETSYIINPEEQFYEYYGG